MAEVLGVLSSAECLGCTIAKGATAGVAVADEEAGVDDGPAAGVETGAPEVAGVTSTAGAVAGTATGVVVGVVTGAPEVAGVASTPGCSVGGVLVGTNSVALGFSEAELGLTEATAVGAAI